MESTGGKNPTHVLQTEMQYSGIAGFTVGVAPQHANPVTGVPGMGSFMVEIFCSSAVANRYEHQPLSSSKKVP